MKPVATQLPEDPPALREMVVSLRAEMANKDQTIRLQQEMIRWLRIDKYGPQSERLNDRQFELLDGEPGVQAGEIDTETAHADDEQSVAPRPKKKPRNPSPGRHPLPAHLPRVEQVIHCSSEQCHCGHCGLV